MHRNLRVAFFRYYPMVNWHCLHQPTMHKSSRCPTPGLVVEILQLIAKHLNITIEVERTRENFNADDWKLMLNGSLDMLSSTDEKNDERAMDFDFTDPLYEVSSVLAVKRADTTLTDMFDFFKVYSMQVWMLVALVFFVVCFIGLSVRLIECHLGLRSDVNIIQFFWRMLRLQFIQSEGGNMNFRLIAGNISLLTFALLQCSIVVSLFQSWILSSIVRLKSPEPFHVEELAHLLERHKYSFVTANPKSWYFQDLKTSFYSPFYEFRNAMTHNPVIVMDSEKDVLKSIEDGDKVVVMQDDERIFFAARGYCDYIFMKSPFPVNSKRFMMRKNHPMLPEINRAIKAQKMLILRVHRKYVTYNTPTHCSKQELQQPALSLRPYYGVLMLFAFGAMLAFLAFAFEVFSIKCKWR